MDPQTEITALTSQVNSLTTNFLALQNVVYSHAHKGYDYTQKLSFSSLPGLDTLVDPNADRILFWDDSASSFAFLTAGTGLSISGTTLTATGTVGGSNTQIQYNNSGAFAGSSELTFGSGAFTVGSSTLAVFNYKLKLPVGTNLYP